MSYKFIFDNNVLSRVSIERLTASGLIEACNSGRFALYIPPVLFTELLHFLSREEISKNAKDNVKFLTKIRWQRVFNDPNGPQGIYTMELEGKLASEYLFINNYDVIRRNLENMLNGMTLRKEDRKEIEEWIEKNNFRCKETIFEMRKDVDKLFKNNPEASRKDYKFLDFLKEQFEDTAKDIIRRGINSFFPKSHLLNLWMKNKKRCLYFNKFIEGLVFWRWYYTMMEPRPRIDDNAFKDIEYLIYLNGVDGIVSNEKNFMKAACTELFPDKDFWSVDEFAEFLIRWGKYTQSDFLCKRPTS